MGVTQSQFEKMMESGQVLAEDFLPKLSARLHDLYGATAAASADSPAAAIERLKNAFFELAAAIGDAGFMSALAGGARVLAAAINGLAHSGALDVIVRGLLAIAAGGLGAWAVERVIGWAAAIRAAVVTTGAAQASMVGLTGAATGLAASTTSATAAQNGLNVAMRANPIGIVIAALFALYEAYEYVTSAEKKRKEEMESLTRQVDAAVQSTRDLNETLHAADGSGFGKLSEASRKYQEDLKTLGSVHEQIAAKEAEYDDASTVYLEHGIKVHSNATAAAQALSVEIHGEPGGGKAGARADHPRREMVKALAQRAWIAAARSAPTQRPC